MEITPNLISEYKTKRRGEGASPRTLNYELALMSHAFNLAIKEWEWVKENPVAKVSKEKVNNHIERWLTLEEQKNLLDKSPNGSRRSSSSRSILVCARVKSLT